MTPYSSASSPTGTTARAVIPAAVLAAIVLAAPAVGAAGATWPSYRLQATIDPPTHRLRISADVSLPEAQSGQPVEFVLGANFKVTASNPAVETLEGDAGDKAFAGINGTSEALANRRGVTAYRLTLPAGSTSFHVEYDGLVDLPPTVSEEEYARSFSETPGIIEPKGVYLAGSTLWYPQLAGAQASELITYTLTVNTPQGWHLIAPGNGVSGGADGIARWESPSAVDEISLSGGPLTPYSTAAGRIQAQVYLREPDAALAAKYLDATSRYLRMYSELLGPYPYEKFALVENFWETGYGMPSYTLLGPQIIRFPFILTSSYPHEILHNWWGNSVYVDYATGNWCEGLTAYLADHLFKEVEGQGAEYRRDTLKKYRDFASENGDFPLREFRSRHSAATEAVGYGKTLMGFHMLRRHVGDDAFRQALAAFYKEYRGQRASFGNVRSVFESTTGQDFQRFFDEWTNRPGAADIVVTDVKVHTSGDRYAVTGVIRQRQAGPFEVEVPVVVTTAGGPRHGEGDEPQRRHALHRRNRLQAAGAGRGPGVRRVPHPRPAGNGAEHRPTIRRDRGHRGAADGAGGADRSLARHARPMEKPGEQDHRGHRSGASSSCRRTAACGCSAGRTGSPRSCSRVSPPSA